jgi:hypothetical protein
LAFPQIPKHFLQRSLTLPLEHRGAVLIERLAPASVPCPEFLEFFDEVVQGNHFRVDHRELFGHQAN